MRISERVIFIIILFSRLLRFIPAHLNREVYKSFSAQRLLNYNRLSILCLAKIPFKSKMTLSSVVFIGNDLNSL